MGEYLYMQTRVSQQFMDGMKSSERSFYLTLVTNNKSRDVIAKL